MALGRKDQESGYLRVNQSTISYNNDSGVILNDFRGVTEIKRCSIEENKRNGI